jgi:Uma2 family endonuclease
MVTKTGTPVYELADLFPPQGYWSEDNYLFFDEPRLLEFEDGFVRVLPMPTTEHQDVVLFLLEELLAFTRPSKLGKTLMAPIKVRLKDRSYREPDLVFMLQNNIGRVKSRYWDGADLVVEVVSPDHPPRDYEEKRVDYAKAGIPEYWIVDPQARRVLILTLHGDTYVEHSKAEVEGLAASKLLNGLTVDAKACFACLDQKPA